MRMCMGISVFVCVFFFKRSETQNATITFCLQKKHNNLFAWSVCRWLDSSARKRKRKYKYPYTYTYNINAPVCYAPIKRGKGQTMGNNHN